MTRGVLVALLVLGCGPRVAPVETIVRVHYPAGGKAMTLRGAPPLSWDTGRAMSAGAEDTWTLKLTGVTAALELKPALAETTSRGPAYVVQPGAAIDVFPHFTVTQGEVTARWPAFASAILGNTRPVWVYLPPTYLENPRARFQVLYMQDGQNLFDPAIAYGGTPWWVQKTIDAAAESGAFAEAIVIAPENTADRTAEYTPVIDPSHTDGGKGAAYLRMLIEELKPRVDAELRTLPSREATTIMGSSLGGLISSYAGITRAETFGKIGIMSPSTWWADEVILTMVPMTPATPRPDRVYLDSGDSGPSNDDVTQTAKLADAYRALGYREGDDFKYVVEAGATHNEAYWAERLPGALQFLLGPR